MTENRPADDLPYALLSGMADEFVNAPTIRTKAAAMADALHYAHTEGYVLVEKGTFSPDPLPSQEVSRDQWPNIRPGTRIRIVDVANDVHEVTVTKVGQVYTQSTLNLWRHKKDFARVFVLDKPDPDADLIERMAKAAHETEFIAKWDALHEDTRVERRKAIRAALAVVRESEAGTR